MEADTTGCTLFYYILIAPVGDRNVLATLTFEAFNLLTSVFIFDYDTTRIFNTLIMRVWPSARGDKEVL